MFLTCKETLSCFVCCFCAEKTELTIEDKYKRTMQEIEVLKDELGRFFFKLRSSNPVCLSFM